MIKPTYTIICRKPAIGLLTILDCPSAIIAMFFHLEEGLSERFTSCPNFMFLIIFLILIVKKPKPKIKIIANNKFTNPIKI